MMGVPSAFFSRSEEHTSELQSRVDISYAVFCLKKKMEDPPSPRALRYSACNTDRPEVAPAGAVSLPRGAAMEIDTGDILVVFFFRCRAAPPLPPSSPPPPAPD